MGLRRLHVAALFNGAVFYNVYWIWKTKGLKQNDPQNRKTLAVAGE